MDFTPIELINDGEVKEGKEVAVRGWIYRSRQQGALNFVTVRDPTGIVQVAVKKGVVKDVHFENATKALLESAVIVKGKVKKDERAPGGYELQATEFDVLHFSEVFPISKDQSTEFLLDVRHLWLRSRELTAVMRVKASILEGARLFFKEQGFWEVNAPIIMQGSCEGGSTVFELDYFGKKASLSQSAQLHLEALIFSLEKVYAITPSFRAEKSRTNKHLTEYLHLEGEEAHYDLEANLKLQEEMIAFICHFVAKERKKELELLGRNVKELSSIKTPFKRITYAQAINQLNAKGNDIKYGDDFGVEHEKLLTEDETQPIFITHFPISLKPFYMKETGDKQTVKNADMLAPKGFGEIIGGSERETDVKTMVKKLEAAGEDLKNYEWYLDLRRFGSIQHSGFGLGIERLVRWICGLEHIRDTTPFPRVINRAYP